MKKPFQSALLNGLVLSLIVSLAACKKPAEHNEDSIFNPKASLQEIMTSIIDPNADYVWNSVSTVITSAGVEDHSPQTDEEWSTVRQHALNLAEASNLLLITGRKVAHAGAETSSHPVELGAEHIEQVIAQNRQAFIENARLLHTTAYEAITAIDQKNPEELMRAGEHIQQACEACHAKFWYPDEKTPTFPPLSGS
ncbi:hypothetical protein LG201_09755 [Methylobacillus gramineus]|uniref:hypothetical protein n=1 Tax=Methylobacillus gramineus TaxID=755169 RepID=UPI001CFF9E4F|nr:hypothetical protein [Methylobacillus gramineus]MCB5185484.1 hypothetical protein [Methylobacillus gramineus]